jgi:CubicO group peptidase (beta-lactamase class C family)
MPYAIAPELHLDLYWQDPADPRSRITLEHLLSFTSGKPMQQGFRWSL